MTRLLLAILLIAAASGSLRADPPPKPPLQRGAPTPYRPLGDAFIAGTVEVEDSGIEPVLKPFALPELTSEPEVIHLLFLAKRRPVWLRLDIRREQHPLAVSWQKHFRRLFDSWDRDQDGTLNRYELEHIYSAGSFPLLFKGGYYSRVSGPPPTMATVDRDRDRRASFAELSDYFWPHVRSAMLNTQTLPDSNAVSTVTEELFARLDQNNDQKLSESELAQAEQVLLRLDRDGDECLSVGELLTNPIGPGRSAESSTQMTTMNAMAQTPKNPKVEPKSDAIPLIELYRGELPTGLGHSLLSQYDQNRDHKLSRQEVGWSAERFDRLDANKDGFLDREELNQWRVHGPDAQLTLDFSANSEQCQVIEGPNWPADIGRLRTDPNRLVLRIGSQSVDCAIIPPPPSKQYQKSQGFVESVFPPGKSQLRHTDLVGPQYQYLRIIFDAADANGDGILTREEAINYFDLQRETSEYGLVLTTTLRTPNFFELLDENQDGKLSVREMRTAWSRLKPLETGRSLVITRGVLQPSGVLRLVAGAYQNSQTESRVSQKQGGRRGPLWFQKMDRNGDGDISWAEFLGSQEDFELLDTNNDKLISLAEALAYEARVRPKK